MRKQYFSLDKAINSQKKTGYKRTDNAINELVDNSIQAGVEKNKNKHTEIVILTIEKPVSPGSVRYRINSISVIDNAGGMSQEILYSALAAGEGEHVDINFQKGMGKYGIGLFNSSISQCNKTDIYSWQGKDCYHNFIDCHKFSDPESLYVPEPSKKELPDFYKKNFKNLISENSGGTLVEWKDLDDISWKTSDGFFNNASFLLGRSYRYFLNSKKVTIKLICFTTDNDIDFVEKYNSEIKPVDPLYLMKDTNTPSPYDEKPAFNKYSNGEEVIYFTHEGGQHHGTKSQITIRFSISPEEVRQLQGGSPFGKHAKRNMGVSVLRAGRELEMNQSWLTQDPRERWVGIEIEFPPEMDDIFGVPNNKQYAGDLAKIDEENFLIENSITNNSNLQDYLSENPKEKIKYDISQLISKHLRAMVSSIKEMNKGKKRKIGQAEVLGTNTIGGRNKDGNISTSDQDYINSDQELLISELFKQFRESGADETEAKDTAKAIVDRKLRFTFIKRPMGNQMLFDVTYTVGVITIIINSSHPGYDHLYQLLDLHNEENEDSPALTGLKLLLESWARLEDEADQKLKDQLMDIRYNWGKLARQFFESVDQ